MVGIADVLSLSLNIGHGVCLACCSSMAQLIKVLAEFELHNSL